MKFLKGHKLLLVLFGLTWAGAALSTWTFLVTVQDRGLVTCVGGTNVRINGQSGTVSANVTKCTPDKIFFGGFQ